MSLATPAGEKNELRVMDMKTRDIRRVLQLVFPILIFNPSWSPDNEHILFHQGNLGAQHLRITDDSGNNIVDVLQDDVVFTPAWSPSRHQIAYIGIIVTKPVPPNPYQIYSMNLAQERVTALTSGGTKSRIPLAWRQDGRKILFAYQNIFSRFDKEFKSGDIYVMNADGAKMINLTQTTQKEEYASWSPDGKHIAFDRWLSEEESSIFVMDANGRNSRRLTFEPGINGAPHWSPDGNRIAFLSIWDGGRGIYTMDREGNNIKQITHGQRKFDGAPAWSPHGKWIAFGSGDEGSWGLYLIDPQGHNEMPIIRSKVSQLDSRAMLRPTWSPDSQNLIYVDPEADDDVGLMMIRTDGGLPTQLNTDGLKHWLGPAWSPDGNSLLFSAIKERGLIRPEVEYGLYLMNLNGSERSEFILPIKSDWPDESRMALTRLVWAPDGSQLMLSIESIEVNEAIRRRGREKRLYLIDIPTESIKLWMDDAAEADWVRPGFVYAVNPREKWISTWAELKKR